MNSKDLQHGLDNGSAKELVGVMSQADSRMRLPCFTRSCWSRNQIWHRPFSKGDGSHSILTCWLDTNFAGGWVDPDLLFYIQVFVSPFQFVRDGPCIRDPAWWSVRNVLEIRE